MRLGEYSFFFLLFGVLIFADLCFFFFFFCDT